MSYLGNAEQQSFLDAVWDNKLGPPFSSEKVAKAFFSLTRQLTPRFADYDLVVADDTSGRIAAIVMHKIASNVRVNCGMPKPKLRFVHERVFNYDVPTSLIPEKTSPNARTLIVTEGIASGRHVNNIGRFIEPKREPFSIDIASVGLFSAKKGSPIHEATLFVGDLNTCESPACELYSESSSYKGVVKDLRYPGVIRHLYANRDEINRSRVQAGVFADLLYQAAIKGAIEPPLPYPIHTPEIEKILV